MQILPGIYSVRYIRFILIQYSILFNNFIESVYFPIDKLMQGKTAFTNLNNLIKNLLILILIAGSFSSCKKEQIQVKTIRSKTLSVDQSIQPDTAILNFVLPYQQTLDKEINEVLSYAPEVLTREDGKMQSSIGNIYADLCMERANPVFKKLTGKSIDLALFNFGGIRQSIPKGDIKVIDVFQLMPFENMLVVAELSGEQMEALFQYFEKENSAHPMSGAQLTFSQDTISKILVQNKLFDKKKNYFVLTSDYLQKGGDQMDFFKNPVNLYPLNYKIRDAIIEYLKENDTLQATTDNRIIIQ
jgi:5'-nucleotidase